MENRSLLEKVLLPGPSAGSGPFLMVGYWRWGSRCQWTWLDMPIGLAAAAGKAVFCLCSRFSAVMALAGRWTRGIGRTDVVRTPQSSDVSKVGGWALGVSTNSNLASVPLALLDFAMLTSYCSPVCGLLSRQRGDVEGKKRKGGGGRHRPATSPDCGSFCPPHFLSSARKGGGRGLAVGGALAGPWGARCRGTLVSLALSGCEQGSRSTPKRFYLC